MSRLSIDSAHKGIRTSAPDLFQDGAGLCCFVKARGYVGQQEGARVTAGRGPLMLRTCMQQSGRIPIGPFDRFYRIRAGGQFYVDHRPRHCVTRGERMRPSGAGRSAPGDLVVGGGWGLGGGPKQGVAEIFGAPGAFSRTRLPKTSNPKHRETSQLRRVESHWRCARRHEPPSDRMPHSEPDGPSNKRQKRQKLDAGGKAPSAAARGSTIFAPFRVRFAVAALWFRAVVSRFLTCSRP